MNLKTINDKTNMTYEHYIKQPMQAVEFRLKIIIAKNPYLISSLSRYNKHPLIRKCSHIPINI